MVVFRICVDLLSIVFKPFSDQTSCMQEKRIAVYQKLFVTLSAIIVMLFVFLHYASRVWIINLPQLRPEENTRFGWISVLLIVTTCLIGAWACRPNFLSIRLKAKIIEMSGAKIIKTDVNRNEG